MKEASFYAKADDWKVRCSLCAHHCLIKPGDVGICGVRRNEGGTLYSLVYGRAIAQHVDPIEKKPLFHFLPGTTSFSVATAGCNFRCRHCQNADISQLPRDRGAILGDELPPDEIVRQARAAGCASISYTYTEPTIFFEYAYDTAVLASAAGLKNVFVSNGYITAEPLRAIAPHLHAANIDLKSSRDAFYTSICGARLQPVLDALRLYRELGIWLEVTTLVIPGENDSDEDLAGCAGFIAKELGTDVPWHVSAFHPTYRLTERPRTPAAALRRAVDIGRAAGLRHVYEGNLPGEGETTACPGCARPVIERLGFRVTANRLRDGRCPHCGGAVAGVWS
ncbi:MAG TPA: AmmeMemoRadiSam system radical SAM enzyme [bacterium]